MSTMYRVIRCKSYKKTVKYFKRYAINNMFIVILILIQTNVSSASSATFSNKLDGTSKKKF